MMLVLTLRTDKPEAEIGLYDGSRRVGYETWQAHRALAETLLIKIEAVLKAHDYELVDVGGLAVYEGPGSFTGLRIGLSTANAIAYSYGLPIVAATGETWQTQAIERLQAGDAQIIALPEYGSPVFITKPRK
jgi:tRNA threonylcarbamoyladenosine biosynthesis protein TsaB